MRIPTLKVKASEERSAESRAGVKSLCLVILSNLKGPAVSSQEPLSRHKSHLH